MTEKQSDADKTGATMKGTPDCETSNDLYVKAIKRTDGVPLLTICD